MTGEVVPVHALGIGVGFLLAAVASASLVNPAALQVCCCGWVVTGIFVNDLRRFLFCCFAGEQSGKSNEMDIKHVYLSEKRKKGSRQRLE